MGIENLLQESGFEKKDGAFLKLCHKGLAVSVLVDKDGWFIMPLIDIAKLPAPEGLPTDRWINFELYWPENSFNAERHTACGRAWDLSAFKNCYTSILELFSRIAKFYDIR